MADKKYVYQFIADAKSLFQTFSQIVTDGRKAGQELKKEFEASAKNLDAAFKTLKIRPFAEIESEIKKVQSAFQDLKDSGKLSSEQLNAAQLAMTNQIKDLSKEMNGVTGESKKMGDQFLKLGTIAKGVVITFLTKESLRAFAEFDAEIRKVWTLTDQTKAQFDKAQQSIVNMSLRLPETATGLAAAQAEIIGSGVAVEQSGKALELAAKAAVAGVTDTQTAAKIGTSIMQTYGLSVNSLSGIYETLFALMKEGVGSFEEVTQSIQKLAPTAKTSGVGLNELSAALATLEGRGVKLPVATGALQTAISVLSGGNQVLKDAGVTWSGLIPTLELLEKKGLTTSEALKNIGIQGEARTALQFLIQDLDLLKKKTEDFAKSTGVFDETYKKNADSYKNQLQLMKNALNALAITIGGELATQLTPVIKAIGVLVQQLVQMDPVMKKTLIYFGEFFAVVKLLQSAAGLAGFVKAMVAANAATATLGATATATGLALNLGIVAAGIAGAAAIAKLVVEMVKLWNALRQKNEVDLGLEKQIDQWKEYKNFQLKTIQDLQRTGPDQLKAYYEELAKANNLFQAEAAKAGTERGFFSLMFGPDETKSEKDAKEKADQIAKQIKMVKALLKGEKLTVEGEIIVDANLDQIEGTIDRIKGKIESMVDSLEGNRGEWDKISASSLRYLEGIDGVKTSQGKLKELIETSLSPQQAVARVLIETNKTMTAMNLTTDQRRAKTAEIEKAVQNIFQAMQKTGEIDRQINDLNTEKIELEKKNGIQISASMEQQAQASANAISSSGRISAAQMKAIDETVGYGMNKSKELQAYLNGQTFVFNLDEKQAQEAFGKLQGMTEAQRQAWIQANGKVQEMTASVKTLGETGTAAGNVMAQGIGSGLERSIGFVKTGIDSLRAIIDGQTFDIKIENAEIAMKELGKMSDDQKIKWIESHEAFKKQIGSIKGVADETTKAVQGIATAAENVTEAVGAVTEVPAALERVGVTRGWEAPTAAVPAPAAAVPVVEKVKPEEIAAQIAEAEKRKESLIADLQNLKTQFDDARTIITEGVATMSESIQAALAQLFDADVMKARIQNMIQDLSGFVDESIDLFTGLYSALAALYRDDETLFIAATQAKMNAATEMINAYTAQVNELIASIGTQIATYQAKAAELKKLEAEKLNLTAQAAPGYAVGGPVRGGIPGIDSVPILAQGGEYVMRRSAVQKYGVALFEALNRGMMNLSKVRPTRPLRYAEGGAVPMQTGASMESNVRIVNVVDSEQLVAPYLRSRKGENVILNMIKDNKAFVRSMVIES